MQNISCAQCGESFKPRRKSTKYCSVACHDRAQRRVPEQTCAQCGATFRRKDAWSKKYAPRFCSRACHTASKHRTYICQFCGVEFFRKRNGEKDSPKYCSHRCRGDAQRKHGPSRKHSYDPRYLKWRAAVVARDVICQGCGATEELQAHHIKSWQDYPELRYDPANGRLLCVPCHQAMHPERGVGGSAARAYPECCRVCGVPIGPYNKTGCCKVHFYAFRRVGVRRVHSTRQST